MKEIKSFRLKPNIDFVNLLIKRRLKRDDEIQTKVIKSLKIIKMN